MFKAFLHCETTADSKALFWWKIKTYLRDNRQKILFVAETMLGNFCNENRWLNEHANFSFAKIVPQWLLKNLFRNFPIYRYLEKFSALK